MGFTEWLFEDERFRRERVAMLVTLLVFGPILLLGGWFLYAELTEELPMEPLLTADQLPPEETFSHAAPASPLLTATQAAAAGRFSEARSILDDVQPTLAGPELSRAWTLRANIDRQEGNHEAALDSLNEAIALESTAWRIFLRGDTLRKLGRIEEAASNLQLAQSLAPAQPLYANAVLLLDIQRGRGEAVAESIRLRAELGLDNTRPAWTFAAAALELARQQPNLAAISLRHGVQAMPSDHVDILMDYAPLNQYRDEGPVMAFFIKTSTERLQVRPKAQQ